MAARGGVEGRNADQAMNADQGIFAQDSWTMGRLTMQAAKLKFDAHATAKHALVGLTRQLAVATAEHGITVNCLCPGWTNTSLLDFERIATRNGTTVEEARAVAERDNAQHRVLEPEELTGMATLLVSDEGAGVTGQVISVDGGYRI